MPENRAFSIAAQSCRHPTPIPPSRARASRAALQWLKGVQAGTLDPWELARALRPTLYPGGTPRLTKDVMATGIRDVWASMTSPAALPAEFRREALREIATAERAAESIVAWLAPPKDRGGSR